jgi:hypothetical protein
MFCTCERSIRRRTFPVRGGPRDAQVKLNLAHRVCALRDFECGHLETSSGMQARAIVSSHALACLLPETAWGFSVFIDWKMRQAVCALISALMVQLNLPTELSRNTPMIIMTELQKATEVVMAELVSLYDGGRLNPAASARSEADRSDAPCRLARQSP